MFEKEVEDNKPPYAFYSFNTKYELWKSGFQQRNYTSKGDLK